MKKISILTALILGVSVNASVFDYATNSGQREKKYEQEIQVDFQAKYVPRPLLKFGNTQDIIDVARQTLKMDLKPFESIITMKNDINFHRKGLDGKYGYIIDCDNHILSNFKTISTALVGFKNCKLDKVLAYSPKIYLENSSGMIKTDSSNEDENYKIKGTVTVKNSDNLRIYAGQEKISFENTEKTTAYIKDGGYKREAIVKKSKVVFENQDMQKPLFLSELTGSDSIVSISGDYKGYSDSWGYGTYSGWYQIGTCNLKNVEIQRHGKENFDSYKSYQNIPQRNCFEGKIENSKIFILTSYRALRNAKNSYFKATYISAKRYCGKNGNSCGNVFYDYEKRVK